LLRLDTTESRNQHPRWVPVGQLTDAKVDSSILRGRRIGSLEWPRVALALKENSGWPDLF